MMGWYSGAMGPLGWVATGVFWVLFLELIVWLISRLLPCSAKPTTTAANSPMEILNSRLAGGEIDLADWQAQHAGLKAPVAGTIDRSGESR